ncbi:MAG: ABC transporter permease subunit [Acidimicrobiia bacterium]
MTRPAQTAGIPLGVLPALATVVLLFGGAIVGLVFDSLRPGRIIGAPIGLDAWRSIIVDGHFHDAIGFTVAIAGASTIISVILALALGAGLQNRPTWLRAAIASAVPIPHLVAASLAVTWLAPGGLADRILGTSPFTIVGDRHGLGIIVVYTLKETPFLLLLVLASWDQHTHESQEAAVALGASPWRSFRDIVMARLAGPLTAGALVVAAFTLGATEVPLLVGPTRPDTIATYALTTVRTDGPAARADAAAALLVVTAMTMVLGLIAAQIQRRIGRLR